MPSWRKGVELAQRKLSEQIKVKKASNNSWTKWDERYEVTIEHIPYTKAMSIW
jgi:hypothetical protein